MFWMNHLRAFQTEGGKVLFAAVTEREKFRGKFLLFGCSPCRGVGWGLGVNREGALLLLASSLEDRSRDTSAAATMTESEDKQKF